MPTSAHSKIPTDIHRDDEGIVPYKKYRTTPIFLTDEKVPGI